jgi:hypothetical protein
MRQEEFELEPVWPALTRCLLGETARAYRRTLLVPMTIARERTFRQIVGALRQSGHDVRHFTLLAAANTIRDRLRARGEAPDKWGELSLEGLQVERCLQALASPLFGVHLHTDVPLVGLNARTECIPLPDDRRTFELNEDDWFLDQIDPSGSAMCGKVVASCRSTKARISSMLSRPDTPTISTSPSYCPTNRATWGATPLHVGHHGAQNHTATSRPAYSAPRNVPPASSGALNRSSSGISAGSSSRSS